MFNIYLNDIVNSSKFFKVMFADDTNFLLSMKNCKELETVANEELLNINDYFVSNGLFMHPLCGNLKAKNLFLNRSSS